MIVLKDHFPMEEWEQMRSFLGECYRQDHVLLHRGFFEWQFQVNRNDGNAGILCAWENGRLLGMEGYLRLLVHWGELSNPAEAIWILYWMVRKEAPRGLGWLLAKKHLERHSLLLTVNASKIGGPFLETLGWFFSPRIPRYLCVLDKKQCVAMLLPGAKESDLDALAFKSECPSVSSSISEVMPTKESYEPNWQLYPGLVFGTVRSLDYLTWRYINHPVFKYHVVLKGDPKRPAVCVYRIERAFGHCNALVGRIVDFFHPNDEQGKSEGLTLMESVLWHLEKGGCAYADFICSNRIYSQSMIDSGGGEEPGDNQILPVRLTPIENVARHQNLAYYAPQGYPSPTLERIYITKSDIDGDSPASIPANVNVAT